ncbi:hypothetical protein BGX34_003396 [Mortierella sp. NVP85]|nr:hypothetical protein BGX34_003396 [Mortierella sp. NVP85]
MRFSIIAIALSLAASVTAAPLEKRIIGGTAAGENEIPFIAEFLSRNSPCTGFVVHPRAIMTAAHCMNNRGRTGVVYGSNRHKGGTSAHIVKWLPHPDYNRTLNHHDIGLVFVEKKISVKPANLYTPPHSYPKTGSKVVAAGYGDIKVAVGDQPPVHSEVLNKVTLYASSKTTCKNNYHDFLGDYQFCTDYKPLGHSVCHGDSGGPVMVGTGRDRYVIGLINHGVGRGIKCGETGGYQYHTYIKPYLPWVEDEIERFLDSE